MFQGDSLSVFLTFVSFAVGTAVTAYTSAGAKARNLWIVTLIFGALAAGWIALQARLNIEPSALFRYLVISVPAVTVSLVALMLKRAPQPPEVATQQPVLEAAPDPKQVRRTVLIAINKAMENASIAALSRTERAAETALPEMEAAVLSAHKAFNVPLPKFRDDDPRLSLEALRRYAEKILPFLKAEHDEEAREQGAKYLEKFKALG